MRAVDKEYRSFTKCSDKFKSKNMSQCTDDMVLMLFLNYILAYGD